MTNRDERHGIGDGRIRMNLHCFNEKCRNPSREWYTNFVQVACLPDIWAGPWTMRQYGFIVDVGSWYVKIESKGYETAVQTNLPEEFKKKQLPGIHGMRDPHVMVGTYTGSIVITNLKNFTTTIKPVAFSTGDHMHKEVLAFIDEHYHVERAKRLIVFT